MAVIDYTDVEVAIGRPISEEAEQAQVTQWIADVELVLTARLGNLALLDEDVLAYVAREAVVARMRFRNDRNAEADGQPAESENNFFLRILSPWWALLDPGESGSTAFSARPYFESDATESDTWATA